MTPQISKLINKLIQIIVSSKQGCKETELVVELSEIVYLKKIESYFKKNNIELDTEDQFALIDLYSSQSYINATIMVDILEEMKSNEDVTYIDYTLPAMDYKVKSILFPPDTKIYTYDDKVILNLKNWVLKNYDSTSIKFN